MTHDPKVLETIVALAKEYRKETANMGFSSFVEWLANYPVPKEKWVPVFGTTAWTSYGDGEIYRVCYDGSFRVIGWHPTKESAEARVAQIREFIKTLDEQ